MFLSYGIVIEETPMIFGNGVVIIELLLLCVAKWKYRTRLYRPDIQHRYQYSNSNIPNTVFEEDVEMNIGENLYDDPNINKYEMQNVRRRHSSSGSNENSWVFNYFCFNEFNGDEFVLFCVVAAKYIEGVD